MIKKNDVVKTMTIRNPANSVDGTKSDPTCDDDDLVGTDRESKPSLPTTASVTEALLTKPLIETEPTLNVIDIVAIV